MLLHVCRAATQATVSGPLLLSISPVLTLCLAKSDKQALHSGSDEVLQSECSLHKPAAICKLRSATCVPTLAAYHLLWRHALSVSLPVFALRPPETLAPLYIFQLVVFAADQSSQAPLLLCQRTEGASAARCRCYARPRQSLLPWLLCLPEVLMTGEVLPRLAQTPLEHHAAKQAPV